MQAAVVEQPSVEAPQVAEQPAAPAPAAQRVMMSRAELELYVKEGRPTGFLLKSVATLKGLSTAAVAKSSGIPAALVQSIFDDHGVSAIKRGAIKRVAMVIGIDLSCMRLAGGQVHVFNMGNLPTLMGAVTLRRVMRGIGLLARGAQVAELKVERGMRSWFGGPTMHVAQKDNFRALFVSGTFKSFAIGFIPSGTWVCGKREQSVVPVENSELSKNLIAGDLTEGEFDELFLGASALTWDDIRVASRVNGVTKAELLRFIESRANEIDATDDAEEKKAALENRPFLRLVETERPARQPAARTA